MNVRFLWEPKTEMAQFCIKILIGLVLGKDFTEMVFFAIAGNSYY